MIAGRNVALIGFMASGKTSVGEALSVRTGLPFRDVDGLIEGMEGATIAEIFATRGEAYFREREGALFRGLCEGQDQIIGCGGGTLMDPRNRTALVTRCVAVWLRASAAETIRRIETPGAPMRPLVKGADPRIIVPSLLRAREGLYQGAELLVDTDGRTIEEITEEIRLALDLSLREEP